MSRGYEGCFVGIYYSYFMSFNTVFAILDIQYTTVHNVGKKSHMLSKPAFLKKNTVRTVIL